MKTFRLTLMCALAATAAWGCNTDDENMSDDGMSDAGGGTGETDGTGDTEGTGDTGDTGDTEDAGDTEGMEDAGETTGAGDTDMTDTDTGMEEMDGGMMPMPKDPDKADVVEIDRFSEAAGTLMVRTADNGLPEANEPIDFDQGPFITHGLGPDGQMTEYYNFDVQSTTPAPIYVLVRDGEQDPVEGQLNIVDVVPGDDGYNDFWQVVLVTVDQDYMANTYTSYDEVMDMPMEGTEMLVNCPVVPEGSTATMRYGTEDSGLHRGWYQGDVVNYFTFEEAPLMGATVPVSPIYVTFNLNPDEDGGGPPSGFVMEQDSMQTHNVLATLPDDDGYSPLWLVNIYDNAAFDTVSDLASAMDADQLAAGAATVNCPVVSVGEKAAPEPKDPNEANVVEVDRFSEAAGTLMVRTADNGLPEANQAIDFDQGPFITQGLGPDGEMTEYYNFDVQSTTPAPIYVLVRDGEQSPVEGQLNIVDVIPGDDGYNDFWQVVFVTVDQDYMANVYTSYDEIMDMPMEGTEMLVNCPVVPEGSTATMRYGSEDPGLHQGWYKGDVLNYFTFEEAPLMGATVPVSPIYVTFNLNPDQDGGGPPSGFVMEQDSMQTHNVLATLPGDDGYSPLWLVNIYDNAAFDTVSDLTSAMAADQLAAGAATVNCPVVSVQ